MGSPTNWLLDMLLLFRYGKKREKIFAYDRNIQYIYIAINQMSHWECANLADRVRMLRRDMWRCSRFHMCTARTLSFIFSPKTFLPKQSVAIFRNHSQINEYISNIQFWIECWNIAHDFLQQKHIFQTKIWRMIK